MQRWMIRKVLKNNGNTRLSFIAILISRGVPVAISQLNGSTGIREIESYGGQLGPVEKKDWTVKIK